jgi:N-acetylmuramoyl-L-alanine amidase
MRRKRKRIMIWITDRTKFKMMVIIAMLALSVVVLTYDLPSSKTWTHWGMPLSGKIIALDPGHGGPDGGAVSRDGILEKDINLAISLYLRDYLQQAGALVVMTREDDKDLADPETRGRRKKEDLYRRVEFVKEKGSDMLISIHMNSIPSSRWSGAQTFYYPKQHEGNELLATFIQEELKLNLGNTNRMVKTANTIFLLKSIEVPTALVEVGFLSNPGEAALLANEAYQKKAAAAIYRGILRYTSGEKLGSS